MSSTKSVAPELKQEISDFDQEKLKKAETVEKNTLPSPDVISQEKTIHGIQEFQKDSLKHVESLEKNPLPTKETIEQERRLSKS